ncbi:probable galactinol--sucrose galactosyltransferase 2 [Rhododendron vialii]|uniref:probable galactinol--sucrose galactosyltransferase 2 n=1 Tax=Rhododendron vialii TaxID=182163 RepID=UPI00265ECD8B|nr:probable galactinol--sucrose galactosyltransferase 2 [Rhododendron vialii]XP_058193859.1 probable galactinol--sucrose galactosyltransferase 2 [Rhododendron vialii]
MTITTTPVVKDGCLMVRGKVVLTGVPPNVVISPASGGSAFIGASSKNLSSYHVCSLGVLEGYKFVCLFIAKIWWMIPRHGKSGSEIPMETQMLLLEVKEKSVPSDEASFEPDTGNTFYILLLPTLDGPFRTTLQGTTSNELQFCIESGDPNVQTSQAFEAVFMNSGDNPFELIKDSIKILERHKGTFSHIENKKIPAHLDWFGWCTWDAFYTKVNPKGIKEGLQSFQEGGCSPKFLIIDDGWQETVNEFHKEGEPLIEGTQFATRLVDIKENSKFKASGSDNSCIDLKEFIETIKEKYGLKYVYMWHALAGYWGGLLPSSENLKKYNPKIAYPVQSPGNLGNITDIVLDSLEKYGVGVIDPEKVYDFYNDQHSYLASSGVDGVKVDVQNLMETLGSGLGGRVSVTRQYQQALEESISKNFADNNLIACMCHNTDSIYSSKKSATARASEDFMPNEPTFQSLHIASVAFNSLLLGEIVVPDWDMFHSNHNTADFHGAARAIGGCAVYVSDKPGEHDFEILRKLVLPDGSILRAKYAGRPTRDCLFQDPVMDGKSLFKIWNMNKLSGVVGVFNCQGAGSWLMKQVAQEVTNLTSTAKPLSARISPLHVEFLEEVAGGDWSGDCAVYAFNSGSLSKVPNKESLEVSLDVLKCEIFTISPIKVYNQNIHFAPIGLLDMYNSGGATESLNCSLDPKGCSIKIKARGCDRFGAYSNTKPLCCKVDMKEEEFTYIVEDGLLTLELEGECSLKEIEVSY